MPKSRQRKSHKRKTQHNRRELETKRKSAIIKHERLVDDIIKAKELDLLESTGAKMDIENVELQKQLHEIKI